MLKSNIDCPSTLILLRLLSQLIMRDICACFLVYNVYDIMFSYYLLCAIDEIIYNCKFRTS